MSDYQLDTHLTPADRWLAIVTWAAITVRSVLPIPGRTFGQQFMLLTIVLWMTALVAAVLWDGIREYNERCGRRLVKLGHRKYFVSD